MNALKYQKYAQSYENDGFSSFLSVLKLDADIYHNAKVCGQWLLKENRLGSTCFHIVLTGNLNLDVPGHFKGILNAGDLVIFPRELPHKMKPTAQMKGPQKHLNFNESQNIDGTGLLCGVVNFSHRGSQFLLDALPAIFVLRFNPSNYWLKSLLDLFVAENLSSGTASQVIVSRLSEILFIYALRFFVTDSPKQGSVLALYGNEKLSRVIDAIHNKPEYDWTIDELAEIAVMSRTTFHETFKKTSGWTATQYLTWWRMQLAWTSIKSGEGVSETSAKVGYQSESAFSKVFKKTFGISAGQVRRENIKNNSKL